MSVSGRVFILARLPFSNTSLIVRCLSQTSGRVTLIAKGALRPKSLFSGLLDLFYLADVLYLPNRSGDMHTLTEIKLLEPHLGLRHSYTSLLAVQYFAFLIEKMTEPGTPLPAEYDLFGKAVTYLCESPMTYKVMERFEHRLLALAGVADSNPDLPRSFASLHLQVPSLRQDLLRLLSKST